MQICGCETTKGLIKNLQTISLALVVWRMDNAIHWINLYPMDNAMRFATTYPLDSDLSVGYCYPPFLQLGPGVCLFLFRSFFLSSIMPR